MTKNNNYPLFCQFCGSKGLKSNIEESAFKCNRCGRTVYLNSKPSVCAVIIRDDSVLLVRTSGTVSWDLPGGFLLYGESPEEGIKRELMEELHAEVKVERLLTELIDVYGSHGDYSLNLFYEVSLISDKINPGAEIAEYKWFNINELPHIILKSTIQVLTNINHYYPLPIHKFAKQFFGFGENPKTIKIILPSVSQKREVSLKCANYPLFDYEISPDDMLSALRIHSLLTSIYGEIVEVYSHNDIILKPSYNNIFIGGPPTNSFSYQAVMNAPIRFGDDQVNRVIYGKEKCYSIGFSSKNQELRSITEDYSLISKRKKDKNIEFLISGLRAYGQVAIYNFLDEEDFYRKVQDVSQSDSFQILLQIKIKGKACVDWKIVEKTVWDPNSADISIIQEKKAKREYDVFLCHNSKDRDKVKEIGEKLKGRGILPWLAEDELKPGNNWLNELENQIENIKVAAVIIGENGRGPWQDIEINAFTWKYVNQKCRIIPVILPDFKKKDEIPILLKEIVVVDFRNKDIDPIEQLRLGIIAGSDTSIKSK